MQAGKITVPDLSPVIRHLLKMPVPDSNWLRDTIHVLAIAAQINPLISDIFSAIRRKGQKHLGLAPFRPSRGQYAFSIVIKSGGVQRKGALTQHGEIKDGYEQWDCWQTTFTNDLALITSDLVEREGSANDYRALHINQQ